MANIVDNSGAHYAQLQDDVNQKPFAQYPPNSYQQFQAGQGAQIGQAPQNSQALQTGQITVMIGNNPQQVMLPPGWVLVPGPNGQLILQPMQMPAPIIVADPYAIPRSRIHELDQDLFSCYQIWLLLLMVSCVGGTIFLMVNAIMFFFDWSFFIPWAILSILICYCLYLEYQALTQKNLQKARNAFFSLTILQFVLLITYIIVAFVVVDPDTTGIVSVSFWVFMIVFDASVYLGAYKVKKILEDHSRIYLSNNGNPRAPYPQN